MGQALPVGGGQRHHHPRAAVPGEQLLGHRAGRRGDVDGLQPRVGDPPLQRRGRARHREHDAGAVPRRPRAREPVHGDLAGVAGRAGDGVSHRRL
ncbi:MAG: hypothetical protein ACK559_13695, partial [bacterium]